MLGPRAVAALVPARQAALRTENGETILRVTAPALAPTLAPSLAPSLADVVPDLHGTLAALAQGAALSAAIRTVLHDAFGQPVQHDAELSPLPLLARTAQGAPTAQGPTS